MSVRRNKAKRRRKEKPSKVTPLAQSKRKAYGVKKLKSAEKQKKEEEEEVESNINESL